MMVFVLAGTYAEFVRWCHEHGWPREGGPPERHRVNDESAVFVNSREKLLGHHGPARFIRAHNWWKQPEEVLAEFSFQERNIRESA